MSRAALPDWGYGPETQPDPPRVEVVRPFPASTHADAEVGGLHELAIASAALPALSAEDYEYAVIELLSELLRDIARSRQPEVERTLMGESAHESMTELMRERMDDRTARVILRRMACGSSCSASPSRVPRCAAAGRSRSKAATTGCPIRLRG
jgi:phosphoenolpyruvate carboxylase